MSNQRFKDKIQFESFSAQKNLFIWWRKERVKVKETKINQETKQHTKKFPNAFFCVHKQNNMSEEISKKSQPRK